MAKSKGEPATKKKPVKKVVRNPLSKGKTVRCKKRYSTNEVGRPPVFKSVLELKNKIEQYFEFIKGESKMVDQSIGDGETIKIKEWVRHPEPAAISALAYFLGFESRQSVYDYEKNGEFSYTIKRARLRVEFAYEQALLSRYSTGAIFALKNFGWSDKQEVDHTSNGETISTPTPIIFSKGSNGSSD